jgi:Dolichyl-phosphate-mannose-protein mannosyltransferase
VIVLGLILYFIAFVIAGAFIRDLRFADDGETTDAASATQTLPREWRVPYVARLLLVSAPVFGAAAVWIESRRRPLDEPHWDIAALWLLTMAAAIVAVAWPIRRPTLARQVAWFRTYQLEIGAVSIITLIGLIIRVIELDRYTWLYSMDEGIFSFAALDVLSGRLTDPFQTVFQAHPALWFFLQAGVMKIFGEDIAGSRVLAAVVGTATIPVVYIFVRRHMGIATALTAASLVTIFHFEIFWSRNAQNNISAAFSVILVLWLLDLVIDRWKPVDALLAGMAIGLAQQFYVANRVLAPLVGVYLCYSVLAVRPLTQTAVVAACRRALRAGALIVAGFILAVLPLAAYYLDNPEAYTARIKIVSVFGSGWLDQEKLNTGHSASIILWDQFKSAALLPFKTYPSGFYIIPPPFVGWPLAIPIAVGIVLVTICFWKRKYVGLAAAFWATVVGLALTEGRPQTNRYAMAASLLPILGAVGIVEFAKALIAGFRFPKILVTAAVIVAVAGIAYWNLNLYFDDSNPAVRQTDPNLLAADTFAYDLKDLGAGYTIYYAASPRMYWGGHPSMQFIARGETGLDVDDPWTAASAKPELTGPTVFFFIPERRDELAVVQNWFPDGELIERVTPDGDPLYTEYIVRPDSAAAVAP